MHDQQFKIRRTTLFIALILWTMSINLACEDSKKTEEKELKTDCERQRRPIIFIHGFLAAGDTWNRQIRRLLASGSCAEDIKVFDWNTLDMSADHSADLDQVVEQMLSDSSFEQIDLVGHSAGGGVAYTYLAQNEYSSKVNHYVHIGSFANEEPAGPEAEIPTLNLWSRDDLVVDSADIPGATNVELMGLDHYAIATSLESFNQITEFLYDAEALDVDPLSESESNTQKLIQVSGRVLSLGENQPLAQGSIEVWKVDEVGQRVDLIDTLESDLNGNFTISTLETNSYYEWVPNLNDPSAPKVRYFTPILQQNQFYLYLRTFPGEGSLASILVRQLPQTESQTSLVLFNAHRAFLTDQDDLTLDGDPILNQEVASAEDTAIALFIFDINEDGETDGRLPLFEGFPFLSAVDYPIQSQETGSLNINYNGLELNVPKVASKDATIVVIFP